MHNLFGCGFNVNALAVGARIFWQTSSLWFIFFLFFLSLTRSALCARLSFQQHDCCCTLLSLFWSLCVFFSVHLSIRCWILLLIWYHISLHNIRGSVKLPFCISRGRNSIKFGHKPQYFILTFDGVYESLFIGKTESEREKASESKWEKKKR